MSQIAHTTIATPHELHDKVHTLEEWRKLTVDPTLMEHTRKLEAFERIEQRITGAMKFCKVVVSILGVVGTIVEVTRFIVTMAHLIH
jgi:hypothetical protein